MECGECTLCCFFANVPDYDSPEYEYCRHCNKNEGCSNYENRNDICRDFKCFWLKHPEIPDEFRPDKCGVMFEVPYGSDVCIGHVDPDNPDAINSKEIAVFVKKLTEFGHSVVFYTSPKQYKLAKDDTIERVKHSIKTAIRLQSNPRLFPLLYLDDQL